MIYKSYVMTRLLGFCFKPQMDSPRSAQVGVKCKHFTLACNCVFLYKFYMGKKNFYGAVYTGFWATRKFLRIGLRILGSSKTVFVACSTQEPTSRSTDPAVHVKFNMAIDQTNW